MPKGDPAGYLPNVKVARKKGGKSMRPKKAGKNPMAKAIPKR